MKTLKKLIPKLIPIIGLLYFGISAFGAKRGVSFESTTTNVQETVHIRVHSITNLAATASEIAGYDANNKLGSFTAAATRTLLSVPVFDLTDPGAVNIFPFWDDTQNEVDWTSNTALRTLLGIDSNDAVTFGAITGDSFTAGSTNVVGALAAKQPLDADLTALAAIAGAQGAIIYHNGTSWVKLDPGTSGHVLKTQGAGANPQWAAESGGGGGSAPVGTVVGSGTSTQYAIPFYSDATSTNIEPSLITTDSTKTNLNVGGVNANVVVVTNLAQSLSNLGLGTEDSPQFTGIELGHATDNTLTRPGAGRLAVEGNSVVLGAQQITIAGPSAARTITVPDANATMARTDAANTFTGVQTMTSPVFNTKVQLPTAAGSSTLSTGGDAAVNTTGKVIGVHNGTKEVAVPLIYSKEISFDPDAVCDGAVDRLFLFTVGAWAPNGITITRWRCSFEADPTTEVDLDLKRADAFIGVANSAVMDVLDTTAGASTETTAANINGGAVVATGKVVYLEFGTAYTEANHQIIFELEYEIEED